MADFSTPFANGADRRLPNSDERANGFPCGPADQKLFNGLFYQLQRELDAIHQAGGVAGDHSAYNTTLLNIQALIDAATGGGATEGYLLVTQARTRLPHYPEIVSADHRIIVSSPAAGTVRLPGGVTFIHRGIYPVETVETDFVTAASKTYHLRWTYAAGVGTYSLKDLTDVAYNPTALGEGDPAFDSDYDDMLIARVVTNSSNVATITNLANADRMVTSFSKTTSEARTDFNSYAELIAAGYFLQEDLHWARTPQSFVISSDTEISSTVDAGTTIHTESTRYVTSGYAFGYGNVGTSPLSYQSGTITIGVRA